MALEKKIFLDFPGLAVYDELIKEYIQDKAVNSTDEALAALNELAAQVEIDEGKIQANIDAIAKLNGDKTVEGSVAKTVDDAIAELVANAPEALDTLKEIADWIANDETGTAALIARVDENEAAIAANAEKEEQDIANLKAYVDTQDEYYWNNIGSIEELKIQSLFAESQAANQSAAVAIAATEEGKAVKLTANQNITDDIAITKSCYIDANGSTFNGNVTVPADKDVIIVNATFANPVVVA